MKPIVLEPPDSGLRDTAFEVIRSELFAVEAEPVAPFQFAVIPMRRLADQLERALEILTPAQSAAGRDGRLGLLLDCSTEAVTHFDQRLDSWHGALARRYVPAESCIVLTQERRFAEEYAAYCDRTGRTQRLTILPYDFFLKRQALTYGENGKAVFERRLARFEQRRQPRPFLFLSMNHKAQPHRFAFLVRLIRHGVLDKGLVSFAGLEHDRLFSATVPWTRPSPLDGLTDSWLAAGFQRELDQLVAMDTLSLPDDVLTALPSGLIDVDTLLADPDVSYFDDTYFSAVLETEMVHVRHRVTEKPLKPLANFHPFVLFGNHAALDMLRQFGFKTFEPLIDERYDRIVSPQGRFEMAFIQFMHLCRMAEAGRLDLKSVDDAVIHNAEFMLTRFAESYATAYDEPIIAAMTRIAAAATARVARRP